MIERRTVTQETERMVRHYVCDRCGAVLSTEEALKGDSLQNGSVCLCFMEKRSKKHIFALTVT